MRVYKACKKDMVVLSTPKPRSAKKCKRLTPPWSCYLLAGCGSPVVHKQKHECPFLRFELLESIKQPQGVQAHCNKACNKFPLTPSLDIPIYIYTHYMQWYVQYNIQHMFHGHYCHFPVDECGAFPQVAIAALQRMMSAAPGRGKHLRKFPFCLCLI